ncbi:MAG: gamma-glutamyl-gamma-aminobutyrate hydrolase family protein [Rickettsiales bacterium]|nr:gamma-glutamyl-gamma-aminobutyrate hydrolase family protein [Rickettsiales bacterium]
MDNKILIGLTADLQDDQKYSDAPYYALRKNYTEILTQNKAASIILPPIEENIDEYLKMVDGLIITGGNFDIDPTLYNAKEIHKQTIVNHERCRFEYLITKKALEKNISILGICGGMQLLNVIFGGCLIQDLEEHNQSLSIHEQKPYNEPAHGIKIRKNTLLHDIIGQDQIKVNSSHHQAINKLAPNFIESAKSDDGIIEAIEINDKNKFVIGVQWHPEYNVTEADAKIFKTFIKSC